MVPCVFEVFFSSLGDSARDAAISCPRSNRKKAEGLRCKPRSYSSDSCPPPHCHDGTCKGTMRRNFPRAKAARFCRRKSGPSDGCSFGHISCCILWVQGSGLYFRAAESGNVPGRSQRAVIKGPVAVQRAACLAQVPGLSADLNVDVTHRGHRAGRGSSQATWQNCPQCGSQRLFKKCNVADHNRVKSDRERSRKLPLSLWERGFSVAQVKRIWGFQLTGSCT